MYCRFSPSLPFQKAVIESASISTGEVLLVSVRKYIELEVPTCGLCQSLALRNDRFCKKVAKGQHIRLLVYRGSENVS